MGASLQNIYSVAQPKYNWGLLQQLLRSAYIHQVFVLVEGNWDRVFYKNLIKANKVNVGIAERNGHGGYHHVEEIVRNISLTVPKAKVIGIRDRDYTRFEKNYKVHPFIFMTDAHSLEMMLLSSSNVQQSLASVLQSFDTLYQEVISDARYIASFYIYSTLEQLNVDFEEKKMRLQYYVNPDGTMLGNWKTKLRSSFFTQPETKSHNISKMSSKLQFLDSLCDNELCRGHDVLNTCYKRIPHGSLALDDIMKIMVNAYTEDDFKQTQLYQSLVKWQDSNGTSIFV